MPAKYTPEQQITAFWNKIAITADDNQCWLWLAGCNKHGYGHARIAGKDVIAHRIAWSHPNYIIPKGMDICHSCDNRLCCNPKHLFIGTRQDNVDDMMKKGRYGIRMPQYGEINSQCKLTSQQVNEIRQRYAAGGISHSKLGKEYNVSRSHIGRIINLKWRNHG